MNIYLRLCAFLTLALAYGGSGSSSDGSSSNTASDTTVTISTLNQFPGSTADAYTGSVTLLFHHEADIVTITYNLETYDTACQSGPSDGVTNSCGIHIHSGSCDNAESVGGYYYSTNTNPWLTSAYTGSSGNFDVNFGYGYDNVAGRALVLHDSAGTTITCNSIQSNSIMLTTFVSFVLLILLI